MRLARRKRPIRKKQPRDGFRAISDFSACREALNALMFKWQNDDCGWDYLPTDKFPELDAYQTCIARLAYLPTWGDIEKRIDQYAARNVRNFAMGQDGEGEHSEEEFGE
jgi:hypothetical protein